MQNCLHIDQAIPVTVYLNDYDQIPLTLTYNDFTNPQSPAPININAWAFSFDLKAAGSDAVIKNYALAAEGGETAYLAVTGDNNNILDMHGMWNDIAETQVDFNGNYRLIQKVTDGSGNIFVHIVYTIYARSY